MADFSADMLDLARAKRSARRQNVRRGLVGAAQAFLGGYQPEQQAQPDFTDYNENLVDAYKALVEADEGGMKPEDVLKARVNFVRELLSTAEGRLNKKAEVYTEAQRARFQMQLQQVNRTIDNIGSIVDRQAGGGASAGTSSPEEIAQQITGILAQSPEDVASIPAKFRHSIAKLSPEARQQVVQMVKGASTDERLGKDLAAQFGTSSRNFSPQSMVDEVARLVDDVNRLERMAGAGATPEQIADQTGQSLNLVQELLRLMSRPESRPMYPASLDVPYGGGRKITPGTEGALAQYQTPEGLDNLNTELQNALRGLTGASGGVFGKEIEQQLQGLGFASLDEAFQRIGLTPGDPAADARSAALRKERAPLLDQMGRPDALQPGYQSGVRDILNRDDFKESMRGMGFSDPASGFKQAEKQAMRALRAQGVGDKITSRQAAGAPRSDAMVSKLNARKQKLLERVSPGLKNAAERKHGGGA